MIERIQIPHRALNEHLVLVQCNQLAEGFGCQAIKEQERRIEEPNPDFDYVSVKVEDKEPPKELGDAVRALLAGECAEGHFLEGLGADPGVRLGVVQHHRRAVPDLSGPQNHLVQGPH